MASQPTPRETNDTFDTRDENDQVDIEKIKSLLTEDQVLSDTVARRRRRFTKKRSTSLTKRDLTPVRKIDEKTTSDEENAIVRKPKSPERPRRPKRYKSLQNRNPSETDSPSVDSNNVSRTSSFRSNHKHIEGTQNEDPKKRICETSEDDGSKSPTDVTKPKTEVSKKRFVRRTAERKKSLSDLAQEEVVALFNKTKKSITNAAIKGRDRFRKDKELVKRSQSVPIQIEKEELIESFRKAQLLDNYKQQEKPRKYSESSVADVIPDIEFAGSTIKKAKTLRPGSRSGIKEIKDIPKYSSKIVEIIDPKTKNVVSKTTVVKVPEVDLKKLFQIPRFYSIRDIYREFKKYNVEMKVEFRRIKVLWNKCVFELFLIVMFCGAAGLVFKFVEGGFENFYKCGVKRVKRDFIDLLWTKSHNLREEDWKSLFRNKLRAFEEELHVAHEAGMTTYSGQRSWSFLNGVVYSLTIVTTIGYGATYPQTKTGRCLTIVYGLIAIPLFLVALKDFGKLFTRVLKYFWSFVRRLYYTGTFRTRKFPQERDILRASYSIRPFQSIVNENVVEIFSRDASSRRMGRFPPTSIRSNNRETESTSSIITPDVSTFSIDDEFNLPISVALSILLVYMLIGALIYSFWEKWDYLDSFYFVFVSLSTIGFGDFVPQNPMCMIATIFYVCFGLALMSMCFNVLTEKLKTTFEHTSVALTSSLGFEGSEIETSIQPLDLVAYDKEKEEEILLDLELGVKAKSSQRYSIEHRRRAENIATDADDEEKPNRVIIDTGKREESKD